MDALGSGRLDSHSRCRKQLSHMLTCSGLYLVARVNTNSSHHVQGVQQAVSRRPSAQSFILVQLSCGEGGFGGPEFSVVIGHGDGSGVHKKVVASLVCGRV